MTQEEDTKSIEDRKIWIFSVQYECSHKKAQRKYQGKPSAFYEVGHQDYYQKAYRRLV